MQLVSINDAMQNLKKYYNDVVTENDVVIVSQDGNLRDNIVLIDLKSYNELKKAKETLDYMVNSVKETKRLSTENVDTSSTSTVYVPTTPITSSINTSENIKPAKAEILYELCRYSDGTLVTFSDIVKNISGEDSIQINFERSSYYGDDIVRFEIPSYKILLKKGHYSEDEISRFKNTLYKNEQSFFKWAREGGPQITVY